MTKVSIALIELENLSGLVNHHRQVCHDSDCLVSIGLARETAVRLAAHVDEHERVLAEEIVRLWPL